MVGFTNPSAASPSTFMGLGSAASSLPSSAPDTPMAARKAATRLRHPSQSPAVDEPDQVQWVSDVQGDTSGRTVGPNLSLTLI